MQVTKRILFIALVMALIIGLTACGSGNQATKTKSSANTKAAQNSKSNNTIKNSQNKQDNADTANSTKGLNLNGRTISIAAYFDASPKPDSLQGKELIAQQKKVEKEYNVKIKYLNVPYGDVTKKLTSSVLAGQPFADMVRLNYKWSLSAAVKKLIQPVPSYAPDMSKYPHLHAMDAIFGQNYGIGTPAAIANGIWYNREIFKNLNLPDPHTLVKEDKWTWSEFETLAKKATVDTNGDGKNDYWGYAGAESDLEQYLLASNDAQMVSLNTGKVDLSNDKVVATLDFMQKLYNTDHVWKTEPKSDPSNWKENHTFKDGDVAMTVGPLYLSGTWKKIDTGFVPFPKGPSGTDWASPRDLSNWVIPKGVKNPQAIIQVYNALQDVKPTEDYFGQNTFESDLKHQDDIDEAKLLMQKIYFNPFLDFDLNKSGYFDILSQIVVKDQNPTSVLKSHQNQFQSIVTSLLNPKQ